MTSDGAIPDWLNPVPFGDVGHGPLPGNPQQWDVMSEDQLQQMREQLLESILSSVVQALRGVFFPGPFGAALDQLIEWASLLFAPEQLLAAINGTYEGNNLALLAIEFLLTPFRWIWEAFSYVFSEFIKPVALYLQELWNQFVADWNDIDWTTPLTAVHSAWMLFVDNVLNFGPWLVSKIEEASGLSDIPNFLATDVLREVWATFNTAWAAISFTSITALWDALRAVLNLIRGTVHWAAVVFQNLTGIDLENLLDSLGVTALAAAFTAWGSTLIGINWLSNPIAGLMTAIGAFITLSQDIGNWFLALVDSWLGWDITTVHDMFSSFQSFVESLVRYFFGDTALADFISAINTIAGKAGATLTEAIKALNGLFGATVSLTDFFENFNFFFKILDTFLPFIPWESIFPYVNWTAVNALTAPTFNPQDIFPDIVFPDVPTLDEAGKLGVDIIGDILTFAQENITNPIIATLLTGLGIDLSKFGVTDINDLSALNLSVLGDVAGSLLTSLSEIPAALLSGVLPPSLLGVIPVSNISQTSPNLITLGSFKEAISVEAADGWSWDFQSAPGSIGGSVKLTITSAKNRYLYSRQAVPVVKGDRIVVNATIKTSGLTVTPAGSLPISVAIIPFIGSTEQPLIPIGNAVGSTTNWTKIGQADNTYYEITDAAWTSVIVRLGVASTANTGGFVWFDDISLTKTGEMQQTLVEFLVDAWEGLWEGAFGIGSGAGKTWADMQNLSYTINDTATQGLTNAGLADGKAQATVDGINQAITGATGSGALPSTVLNNIGGLSDLTTGFTQSGNNLLPDPNINSPRLWTQPGLAVSTAFSYSTSQSLEFTANANGTARSFFFPTNAFLPYAIGTWPDRIYYVECYVYLPAANPNNTATVSLFAQGTILPFNTGTAISPMTFTSTAETWSRVTLTNPTRNSNNTWLSTYKLYGYFKVPTLRNGFTAGLTFTAANASYKVHVDDLAIIDVTDAVNTNDKLYGRPTPADTVAQARIASSLGGTSLSSDLTTINSTATGASGAAATAAGDAAATNTALYGSASRPASNAQVRAVAIAQLGQSKITGLPDEALPVSKSLVDLSADVADLKATRDVTVNQGKTMTINFTTLANSSSLPTTGSQRWSTTYLSSTSGATWGISSGKAAWVGNVSGSGAARIVYLGNGTAGDEKTLTDYQSLRGVLVDPPAIAGGANTRFTAIARVSDDGNTYVWARAFWSGFNLLGEIGCVVGGSSVTWQSNIPLTWSTEMTMKCGVDNDPFTFQVFSGNVRVTTYTDGARQSRLCSENHTTVTAGGQVAHSSTCVKHRRFGAIPTYNANNTSGTVSSVSVSDSAPVLYAGSVARMSRLSTGIVSFAVGENVLPPGTAGFFDTVDYESLDIDGTLSDGVFTVSKERMYSVIARIRLSGFVESVSSINLQVLPSGTSTWVTAQYGPAVWPNDAGYVGGMPGGAAGLSIHGNWLQYLKVGDKVRIVTRRNIGTTSVLTGSAAPTTGYGSAETYFSISGLP